MIGVERSGAVGPFLLNNFLSPVWRRDERRIPQSAMPALYILGMTNFALSLPIRIALVATTAIRIFVLLAATVFKGRFREVPQNLKGSGLVFLGSVGELISCVIGIVCPPAAYRIDEFIQNNQIINQWYHDHYLSVWSNRLNAGNAFRAQNNAQIRNLGLVDNIDRLLVDNIDRLLNDFQFNLNERRMDAKEGRAADHLAYFRTGKIELEKWIAADQIEGMMPSILCKIAILGVLGAIEQEDSLSVFVNELANSDLRIELETRFNEITNSINRYMDQHALSRVEVTRNLTYFVLSELDGENPSEYFVKGLETQNEIEMFLAPLKGTQLEEIASLLRQFTDRLFAEDRTMYAVIGRAAYQNAD